MTAESHRDAPSERCLFVTGVTGLVGGYALARLCCRENLDVHVLVRAAEDRSPRQRLDDLAGFFGSPGLFDKVTVHEGDLSCPGLGLDAAVVEELRSRVTDVLHSAASISFENAAENLRTNEMGTQRLMETLPPPVRFFHVSTAYVGGQADTFDERELDIGQTFRNDYERSKFRVETAIREAYGDCPGQLTVLRPSIVVGEYDTGKTFQFLTLYKVLRMMVAFAKRHPGEEFALTFAPQGTQNYIPVDHLTDMIEEIFFSPHLWGETFHLVNDCPITNREFQEILERRFGFRIVNREPGEQSRALNRVSVESMAKYLTYLDGEPRFGCAMRNQLGASQRRMTFDQAYLERLLGYCEQTGWGKRLAVCR